MSVLNIEDIRGTHVVRLARSNKKNALRQQERNELAELLVRLGGYEERAPSIVIASQDEAFSSGQDLAEAIDFTPSDVPQWIDEHMRLYRAILSYPRIVIAAVDGCCIGAGFQSALLCDVRVASTRAYFAMPELDDGIPCVLGTWALLDVIGRARTMELVATCRRLDAGEAKAWGLVAEVVPPEQLLLRTIELAESIGAKSALALMLTKRRVAAMCLSQEEEVSSYAKRAHGLAFGTGHPRELMAMFLRGERSQRSLG